MLRQQDPLPHPPEAEPEAAGHPHRAPRCPDIPLFRGARGVHRVDPRPDAWHLGAAARVRRSSTRALAAPRRAARRWCATAARSSRCSWAARRRHWRARRGASSTWLSMFFGLAELLDGHVVSAWTVMRWPRKEWVVLFPSTCLAGSGPRFDVRDGVVLNVAALPHPETRLMPDDGVSRRDDGSGARSPANRVAAARPCVSPPGPTGGSLRSARSPCSAPMSVLHRAPLLR